MWRDQPHYKGIPVTCLIGTILIVLVIFFFPKCENYAPGGNAFWHVGNLAGPITLGEGQRVYLEQLRQDYENAHQGASLVPTRYVEDDRGYSSVYKPADIQIDDIAAY